MSDLKDLKNFADEVTPIIQDLVTKWVANQEPPNTSAETAAIEKLRNLLAHAAESTARTPDECAETLAALDTALTEVLIQAASNATVALPRTKVMLIKEQVVAINDALGQLAQRAALAPLAALLPQPEVDRISADLQAARVGIQQRRTAQAILDTIVDVVIIAAKVAIKVAAA